MGARTQCGTLTTSNFMTVMVTMLFPTTLWASVGCDKSVPLPPASSAEQQAFAASFLALLNGDNLVTMKAALNSYLAGTCFVRNLMFTSAAFQPLQPNPLC
jgi:hypothetical protein